jgi:gamma-glutamyltranspeptidase/glutathione hydrolase
MKLSYFLTVLSIFIFFSHVFSGVPKPVHAKKAMVASADRHATEAGIDVLKRGGNAIDAAVAVGFTLAVTYPQAGNIGGGGFMMIRMADGNIYALDYREKAPAAAHRDMYLDNEGEVIADVSTTGYLASGVPGTVHGLYTAHQKFGKLPWSELIRYAIDFAESGFILNRYIADSMTEHLDTFLQFESSKKIFTKNGQSYSEADTLIQSDLAATLKRIQKSGIQGFYRDANADRISDEMKTHGGLITTEDLENYSSIWREAIQISYRGYTIFSVPPPSSGGVLLAEILNAVENINLEALGHNSSDLIHLWTEIEKQAYSDRSVYLGDPDFISIPVNRLTSKPYGLQLFKNVNPYYARSAEVDQALLKEHMQTTHFSIIDTDGNAVSNTYTLNSSFGSGVVIEGTGILLNNEMDDFAIKAGYPNIYGLIGSEANQIAPDKRMLSSMTPTIITNADSLFMLLGSPGGSTIITTVAQVISNVIDHKMNIRTAIEAPRFHHQWLPDSIKLEKSGFAMDVLMNLTRKGHKYRIIDSIGDVHAVLRDRKLKEWTGWSDPRGNGFCKGI